MHHAIMAMGNNWGTAVNNNQGDAVIAGIAINQRNAELMDFSQPYLKFPARFVGRADGQLPSREAIKNKVGVREGSSQAQFLAKHFKALEPVPFENEQQALEAVKFGDVDRAFVDGMRASFWLNANPGLLHICRWSLFFKRNLWNRSRHCRQKWQRRHTARHQYWVASRARKRQIFGALPQVVSCEFLRLASGLSLSPLGFIFNLKNGSRIDHKNVSGPLSWASGWPITILSCPNSGSIL